MKTAQEPEKAQNGDAAQATSELSTFTFEEQEALTGVVVGLLQDDEHRIKVAAESLEVEDYKRLFHGLQQTFRQLMKQWGLSEQIGLRLVEDVEESLPGMFNNGNGSGHLLDAEQHVTGEDNKTHRFEAVAKTLALAMVVASLVGELATETGKTVETVLGETFDQVYWPIETSFN